MEKWIGLRCANVFFKLKTTLAYTGVFNFTHILTLSHSHLAQISHTVSLSINKTVKNNDYDYIMFNIYLNIYLYMCTIVYMCTSQGGEEILGTAAY